MNHKEDLIAGRNAVIEALRAKKPIDKIFDWMDVRMDRSVRS